MAIRSNGDPHHRVGVAVGLDNARFVRPLGQAGADAAHGIAHVVGGLVDVPACLELDNGAAAPAPALRGNGLDARHARDGAFDDLCNVGIDNLGCGAGVGGDHGDHSGIHVGQLAYGQAEERGDTEYDDHQARDER